MRAVGRLLFAASCLALIGDTGSAAPLSENRATPTIVNKVVPVDGSTMSLHLSGSGNVTVVLEAGFGGNHRTWSAVQLLLSPFARVVSYDRLDYGGSGRSPRPRTAQVAAEQLREGLSRAGLKPPFVLVGHSYGGALVRAFASEYPQDVHGLVLVDPAMEDFHTRAATKAPKAYLEILEEALTDDDKNASEALKRENLAYETSMVQTRLSKPPPGSQIILISAAQQLKAWPELQSLWLEAQAKWARKVGARHVIVDSGHNVHRSKPDTVVAAVQSLLRRDAR